MVRLDRSLRRISRQFEENVYTTLKVGPRGRMTDAQLYKRYFDFLVFQRCFIRKYPMDKRKFIDIFETKLAIFDPKWIFS